MMSEPAWAKTKSDKELRNICRMFHVRDADILKRNEMIQQCNYLNVLPRSKTDIYETKLISNNNNNNNEQKENEKQMYKLKISGFVAVIIVGFAFMVLYFRFSKG